MAVIEFTEVVAVIERFWVCPGRRVSGCMVQGKVKVAPGVARKVLGRLKPATSLEKPTGSPGTVPDGSGATRPIKLKTPDAPRAITNDAGDVMKRRCQHEHLISNAVYEAA
jgi:hypothetical protein